MKVEFGLIGKKLGHSFSKNYFESKFDEEGLGDHSYNLYEIESIEEIKSIIQDHPSLKGLNVTIPFKKDAIKILDEIEGNAKRIGSINVIKIEQKGILKGYNTDYYGFRKSLQDWLQGSDMTTISALVLGSGGSSRSIASVLEDLGIRYEIVSRKKQTNFLTYDDLSSDFSIVRNNRLIINCTPLGMYPDIQSYAPIDYNLISKSHYVYDLVYNPEETLFLNKCKVQGAFTKNGLEMLHLQAEKSWEIWNE